MPPALGAKVPRGVPEDPREPIVKVEEEEVERSRLPEDPTIDPEPERVVATVTAPVSSSLPATVTELKFAAGRETVKEEESTTRSGASATEKVVMAISAVALNSAVSVDPTVSPGYPVLGFQFVGVIQLPSRALPVHKYEAPQAPEAPRSIAAHNASPSLKVRD